MHRIDGPGALAGGHFTEGNPQTNQDATVVTAAFAEAVQEEICNAIEGAGIELDPEDNTQLRQAIEHIAGGGSGGAGGGAGARNLLINGDFTIQQRTGTGSFAITNANKFTLDRWVVRADGPGSGAGTATVSRQAHAFGQVDVPGNPSNYMRYVQNVAATVGPPTILQRVEDVTRFGAGVLTFSLNGKASTTIAGTLRIVQRFGAGGSPSADVIVAQLAISLGTSWAAYEVTADLTGGGFSMVGKTLGSNGDSHLAVELLLPQGSTFTVELSDAQLERSSQASAFARRAPGEELELCRRYYERTGVLTKFLDNSGTGNLSNGARYTQAAPSAAVFPLQSFFAVRKWRIPTMKWWSPSTGTADKIAWNGSDFTVTSTANASEDSTGYPNTATQPLTASGEVLTCSAHWEADAEIN